MSAGVSAPRAAAFDWGGVNGGVKGATSGGGVLREG